MNLFPRVELPPDSTPMWSETLTSAGRATLTLTNSGTVLGLPDDCTDEQAREAKEAIHQWHLGLLILPWPVDVTDLRR